MELSLQSLMNEEEEFSVSINIEGPPKPRGKNRMNIVKKKHLTATGSKGKQARVCYYTK